MLVVTNNSIKYQSFAYKQLNNQTVLFLTIQFSIIHLLAPILNVKSSIWLIDRTLSGATTLGQSRPGIDGNKGVFSIPKNFISTEASPSDCLMSYPGHSFGEGVSYPSAEMQSAYSTALADWTLIGVVVGGSYLSAEMHLVYFTAPANWAWIILLEHFNDILHWQKVCYDVLFYIQKIRSLCL